MTLCLTRPIWHSVGQSFGVCQQGVPIWHIPAVSSLLVNLPMKELCDGYAEIRFAGFAASPAVGYVFPCVLSRGGGMGGMVGQAT